MKISIAGKDRTADLGRAIASEAARLKADGSVGSLSPEHSALRLKETSGRADYLRRYIELLRLRHGTRTTDYYIPRGPGLRGRMAVAMKTFLWKLLRYQHDRMSFQQNLVNELAIDALEFQHDQVERELAELNHRIEDLERKSPGGAA